MEIQGEASPDCGGGGISAVGDDGCKALAAGPDAGATHPGHHQPHQQLSQPANCPVPATGPTSAATSASTAAAGDVSGLTAASVPTVGGGEHDGVVDLSNEAWRLLLGQRLEVKRHPVRGRGVYATTARRPGELIFDSEPYAAVATITSDTCSSCYTTEAPMRKCTACKVINYCSRDCQRKDWQAHRVECKQLQQLAPVQPGPSVRLLARILRRMLLQKDATPDSPEAPMPPTATDMDWLMSNRVKVDESTKERFAQGLMLLQKFLRQSTPSLDECMTVLCKMASNSFHVCNGELQPVGSGVYPKLCLVNHSCLPNCVGNFRGSLLEIRSITKIEPGDEITISYIDFLEPCSMRREKLQLQYFFKCECERCVRECEVEPRRRARHDASAPLQQQASAMRTEGKLKECREVWQRILRKRVSTLPKWHTDVLTALSTVTDLCSELREWPQALEYAIKAQACMERASPVENCPVLGLQLAQVGKLQRYLRHDAEAVESFRRALSILSITHGETHSLVQEIQTLFLQSQAEAAAAAAAAASKG